MKKKLNLMVLSKEEERKVCGGHICPTTCSCPTKPTWRKATNKEGYVHPHNGTVA